MTTSLASVTSVNGASVLKLHAYFRRQIQTLRHCHVNQSAKTGDCRHYKSFEYINVLAF